MDVLRSRKHRLGRSLLVPVTALAVLASVTVAVTRLEGPVPEVERNQLWLGTVSRGEMVREVRGPGTLVSQSRRWVTAVLPGRIERIAVAPGAVVDADTLLIELSNPDIELAALQAAGELAEAEAQLASLRSNRKSEQLAQRAELAEISAELEDARRRAKADEQLSDMAAIAQLEAESSRGRVEGLDTRLSLGQGRLGSVIEGHRAEIEAQDRRVERLREILRFHRAQVERLQIRAEAAGVLQELAIEEGQWVTPGTVVARVGRPDELEAELHIPEVQAKDVVQGQTARIDTHDGVVEGTVTRVDPAVQAGSVTVKVSLEGPLPRGARPALSVIGSIEVERIADVLHVARPAHVQPDAVARLFRSSADGSRAEAVDVRVGRASANTMEIVAGLIEGDEVILSDMSMHDEHDVIEFE